MATPIIIDGNSMIVRCIMATALDDLKAGGLWTGGVYGTLGLLKSFIGDPDLEPGPIYAFFDHGVPPTRLKYLPGYKQERKEKRKLLSDEDKERAFAQLHLARKMMETLGILCLAYRNREADDCVAAAVDVLTALGQEPVVWSSDRDLLQVIAMGARVWNASAMIEPDNFEETVGVPINTYTLYRALIGDPSDSIKGVYGCGPKRAAELIHETAANRMIPMNGLPPGAQLDEVVYRLLALSKLRKFEQTLLEDHARLKNVIKGIDVRLHFGDTEGLAKRMTEHLPVDKMAFLRFCKRMAFRSVLGSPRQYLRPFEEAAERRT